ncbi:hypothetical protein B0T16DRAFT_242358 [Cercophora newfieldiana]|uniref:Uncharacterized protein n=1 Tax=Cercophora newfieldiana TaxID=92897 RepID=A0AA39XSB4_9PEZI|nr:hypothetical protein B0T16DRAFT_242358 [Cercophora newfieldiana]
MHFRGSSAGCSVFNKHGCMLRNAVEEAFLFVLRSEDGICNFGRGFETIEDLLALALHGCWSQLPKREHEFEHNAKSPTWSNLSDATGHRQVERAGAKVAQPLEPRNPRVAETSRILLPALDMLEVYVWSHPNQSTIRAIRVRSFASRRCAPSVSSSLARGITFGPSGSARPSTGRRLCKHRCVAFLPPLSRLNLNSLLLEHTLLNNVAHLIHP